MENKTPVLFSSYRAQTFFIKLLALLSEAPTKRQRLSALRPSMDLERPQAAHRIGPTLDLMWQRMAQQWPDEPFVSQYWNHIGQ